MCEAVSGWVGRDRSEPTSFISRFSGALSIVHGSGTHAGTSKESQCLWRQLPS